MNSGQSILLQSGFGHSMADEVGEPVGLTMGFQAGGLIGLYLGFSLATISVLTDAENVQRTISLMCLPPFIFSLLLGPFLSKRRRPVILTKDNTLVIRGFCGIGYSYKNSEELPIQKQFFSGGVNSIRAWEAFGLGPGSSTDLDNYSTGDIKLEFNIEYRFPLYNSFFISVASSIYILLIILPSGPV